MTGRKYSSQQMELFDVFKQLLARKITSKFKADMQILMAVDSGYNAQVYAYVRKVCRTEILNLSPSWLYFRAYSQHLKDELLFNSDIESRVDKFLHNYGQRFGVEFPSKNSKPCAVVHVQEPRTPPLLQHLNPVPPQFFQKAIMQTLTTNPNTQFFLVAKNEARIEFLNKLPNCKFVRWSNAGNADYEDALNLELAARCQSSIIDNGALSWWMGWMSPGQVTYYLDNQHFSASQYYPPKWHKITA